MRNIIENNNKNKVKIEGTLSEINLEYGSYIKDGVTKERISGTIKIRVDLENGKTLEVPVRMFANKLTNDGNPNGAYAAIQRVKEEMISIAGCPDGATPDCVRLTSGQIAMQEYPNEQGGITSYPTISGTFITKIKPEDCRPQATYEAEIVVADKSEEINKNGEETGRVKVTGVLVGYKGKADIVTFYAEHDAVKDAIASLWDINSTVTVAGDLNFTSTTEEYLKEMAFGAPKKEVRTINVSEFVITGGSEPLDEEFSYDIADIQKALADRKARLEAAKAERAGKKAATVATTEKKKIDLGF